MGAGSRFIAVIAVVSGLLPLAAALLARGMGNGSVPAILVGGIAAGLGVLGLIGLARAVFVLEHRRVDR